MTLVPGSQFTHFAYNPNVAANALYITVFACCFVWQIVQGFRFRTWQFTGPVVVGISFELLGYTSRILMHNDPRARTPFLLNNIALILGPAFLAAAIYLCMGRLVCLYGSDISALKPRTYLVLFVACDLVNLILQGLGGGISSTLQTPKGIQAGINIVIAGLATQVASLLLFIGCCTHFAVRLHQNKHRQPSGYEHVRQTRSFRAFLYGLGIATTGIFTRSLFRMIELRQGFTGPLANNEVYFMVLEGAMILLATLALTVLHPGPAFQRHWNMRSSTSRPATGDAVLLESEPVASKWKGASSTVTETL